LIEHVFHVLNNYKIGVDVENGFSSDLILTMNECDFVDLDLKVGRVT